MKIAYITSNAFKFEEARHVLSSWELVNYPFDLMEIQGEPEQIITAKAKEAHAKLKAPLIVEDVSFCCSAINDLPGPYIKDFLKKIADKGLFELIQRYQDHRAAAICHAAYVDENGDSYLFKGSIQGTVVSPRGFGSISYTSWNAIFQPIGYHKTFAELSVQEHSKISMRYQALTQLRLFLENKK